MTGPSARPKTTLSTPLAAGVASCAALVPLGCRPTPAEITISPDEVEPVANATGACTEVAAPKPAPGSADDRDPPAILGARFVARDRVQLTFSEALAPIEAVNPRQFRLSRASSTIEAVVGERAYATGYYYDLGGPDPYEQPLVVVDLELYEDQPEVLALILSRPIPLEVCEEIAETKADRDQQLLVEEGRKLQIGVFLHYTSRGSVGVRDRVDNPMGELGPEWALHFGTLHKQVYGAEPVTRLDLIPELECPDASMIPSGGPPGPS